MKKAYDQNNKLVDIIESQSNNIYTCPVCHEILIRNFGAQRQFYSHPHDIDATDCEIKMKLIIKEDKSIFQQSESNILSTEFYNKQFDDVEVEMSDYMSEEGYWLTKEQKDIIFSKEDRVKVSALTGSSKSTTLYYYAKEHPFSKILYLVYNKSMQLESEKMFAKQKHVEIRTIHSLGYSFSGKFYRDKLTFNYGVVDIIKDLNLNWDKDMELAVKINAMMKEYSLSSAENFSDLEIFKEDDMRGKILALSEKLWELKKKYKNSVKISHDDYLKMFHLSRTDLSNKYDIIMLDECLPESQYVKTDQGNKSIKKLYEMYNSGKVLPNVLSYNIEKDIFEYKQIVSAMKSENRELLEIHTEGLNKLSCTSNHKILTQRGWVMAQDLVIGKDLLILDDKDTCHYDLIQSVNNVSNEDVYDIEVADNHNFITLQSDNKNDIGIVVHNCQDSSKMMFDILKNSNVKGLVTVGDPYQSIYGFRQSVNIMPLFDAKEYKLTTSFRVSNNIAHIENLIISDFIGDNIKMKGFNTKQTIVDAIDKSKPYACLCRTNAYIFAEIAEALSEDKNKKLFFVGGFSSYSFDSLKQCYSFSQGYPTKNKLFAKFKDYLTMKEYATKIEDLEILSLIRMVDKYGSKIIDIVDGIKNNAVTDKSKADIIFSTIHKSKGLSIDIPVYISNDHLDLEVAYRNKYLKRDEDYSGKKKVEKDISQEIFCIYVGISRCKSSIELSDSIKRYLLMRYKDMGHELHNVINNINEQKEVI